MDNIYREHILDHYRYPRNFGNLNQADLKSEENNPSCGDRIKIEIKLDGNNIEDIRFNGEGCAVSIACASMLTDQVLGMTVQQAAKIDTQQHLSQLGTSLTATRTKCALLSLEVLHKTLAQYKTS